MSVPNPHIRFTYDEYKTLPESMEKRYELLDGDILMVPAPTTVHQRISRNLEYLLLHIVRKDKLGAVFYSPVDVVFGQATEREVVEPDIIFITRERMGIVSRNEIQGAPDLMVEILSPGTEERDRGYKKVLYSRYGVREYWIVDPDQAVVEVYRHEAGGLKLAQTLLETDRLSTPLLGNSAIDLTEVFAPD